MFRYGILSTAAIVSRFVAGIRESKEGKVVAIASRNIETAKKAANDLNIENYYGSYEELYQDSSIDIIYIPTVNGLHYQNCKMALQHKKHVIVEKPFTLNTKDAKELYEIAKQNQCFIMEAQKSVFLPTTNKVKQLIEKNIIGEIKYIELRASFPARFTYDHWMYDLAMGGGALYGSATYTIELLKYLFNRPNIQIQGFDIKCPTGADEICSFQLKLNQNILVNSTIAMNISLHNEAIIYGQNGNITIPNYWKSNHCIVSLNDGTRTRYDLPYSSEFVYEIEHIHECIKTKQLTSPIMNPEMTLETIDLVTQLHNSFKCS